MKKSDYDIQMRSLKSCLHHLQTLDLDGMQVAADQHGTFAEASLVQGVRVWLRALPPIHP